MTGHVVGLAGDWHGNLPWAQARIADIAKRGVRTIWHLGDFSVWPGPSGRKFLFRVERALAEHGIDLLVTPGNHEDWGRLTTLWANPKRRDETGEMQPLALTDHIRVLPRGFAWEQPVIVEGQTTTRKIVSLGGAPSVDLEHRTEGRDWWPAEEMIQPEDVARTIRNGAGADVMLSHDSPDLPYVTPAVRRIIERNDLGWSERALAYARVGRERLSEALLGVMPRLLVHGHYHVRDETSFVMAGDREMRIWSLGCDGMAGNLRYLDLATLRDPEWGSDGA